MSKKQLTEVQLIALGVVLAESFMKIDANASQGKREVVLTMAETHATNADNLKAVLTGYQKGFIDLGMSESSAKVRKAEANAVCQAVIQTEVSKDNTKLLREFDGGYHDWIAYARTLRGTKERTTSTRTSKKEAMTTSQYDKVETMLEKASPEQLQMVASQNVINMHKKAGSDLAGFQTLILLQQAANSLVNTNAKDEFFKRVGNDVLAIVEKAIEQCKAAKVTAEELQENVAQGTETQVEQVQEKVA